MTLYTRCSSSQTGLVAIEQLHEHKKSSCIYAFLFTLGPSYYIHYFACLSSCISACQPCLPCLPICPTCLLTSLKFFYDCSIHFILIWHILARESNLQIIFYRFLFPLFILQKNCKKCVKDVEQLRKSNNKMLTSSHSNVFSNSAKLIAILSIS